MREKKRRSASWLQLNALSFVKSKRDALLHQVRVTYISVFVVIVVVDSIEVVS